MNARNTPAHAAHPANGPLGAHARWHQGWLMRWEVETETETEAEGADGVGRNPPSAEARTARTGNTAGAPVHHQPSPNHGPRPDGVVVDLLVIHSISLPPGQYGTGQVDRLFTNRLDHDAHPYFQTLRGLEVSAHFFIDRTGALTQYVATDRRAWHAGRSCWRGREQCNDWSVGVELEGLEGDRFEPAQYQTLSALVLALQQVCPLREAVGHEHIAPGRKQDPGPGFDWAAFARSPGGQRLLMPEQPAG